MPGEILLFFAFNMIDFPNRSHWHDLNTLPPNHEIVLFKACETKEEVTDVEPEIRNDEDLLEALNRSNIHKRPQIGVPIHFWMSQ